MHGNGFRQTSSPDLLKTCSPAPSSVSPKQATAMPRLAAWSSPRWTGTDQFWPMKQEIMSVPPKKCVKTRVLKKAHHKKRGFLKNPDTHHNRNVRKIQGACSIWKTDRGASFWETRRQISKSPTRALDGARSKKQVWHPHVRTWGLSEANALFSKKCLWHCWDFSAPPAVIRRPGIVPPFPSLRPWSANEISQRTK